MIVLASKTETSRADMIAATTAARALTGAEVTTLKAEIANDPESRGYAGKTDAQTLTLICSAYQQANPVPQPRVPQPFPGDTLKGFLLLRLSSISDPTIKAKWQQEVSGLLLFCTQVIQMTDPAIGPLLNGIAGQAVADGVFTQADWDALTTVPDTTWEAATTMDDRASSMLNLRYVVLDLADVAALRA